MEIGEKLRVLRRSLGLTQQQMVAGKMDRSFYSRIEGGKNTITANDLLKVLKVHNVSALEFLKDEQVGTVDSWDYQDQLVEAYFARDAEKLSELQQILEVKDSKLKLAAEFLQAKLNGKVEELSVEDKQQMRYIVFQISYVDSEMLWYLFVFMDLYDFDELQGLVNSIFKKFKRLKNCDSRTLQMMAIVGVRYLKFCKKYHADKELAKTASFISKLPTNENTFLAKAVSLCLTGKDEDHTLAFYLREVGYEKYLDKCNL